MTPYFLIGMGALDGIGALINKNTFEGGTYSKGWPPAGAKSAAKSETTATTKQTDIWICRNLVPRALFPSVCLTSDRNAIDINIFRSHAQRLSHQLVYYALNRTSGWTFDNNTTMT